MKINKLLKVSVVGLLMTCSGSIFANCVPTPSPLPNFKYEIKGSIFTKEFMEFQYFKLSVQNFRPVEPVWYYFLGYCYQTGYGVKKSLINAYANYKAAQKLKYKPAEKVLDCLNKTMNPDVIQKANRVYEKSIKHTFNQKLGNN